MTATDKIARAAQAMVAAMAALALAGCSGGAAAPATSGAVETPNQNPVSLLIASSGTAETEAVKAAASAWSKESGVPTEVIVASDLAQEAAQGFASGKPADLLYVSTDNLTGWVENGSLEAYGDKLSNAGDFYPGLKDAFTVDGTFYAAPKDFSTLALVINTDMWADAGLTDADVPTTWDQLATVAKKLTKGKRVGLAFGAELQRVGVFMAQAGGGLVTDGQATANSDPNVQALTYVKQLLTDGSAAFAADLGAGWGGEAFGKEMAAMVIEGNWITGAMQNDFSDVKYKVVELPAGTQKGTLQYTNAWGLAADGDNKAAAIQLVQYLTSTEQQLAAAKAFGVMPSVQSAADGYRSEFPEMAAFLAGADYAQNLPSMKGAAAVITEFNSQLSQLKSKDPKAILDETQANLEPVVAG